MQWNFVEFGGKLENCEVPVSAPGTYEVKWQRDSFQQSPFPLQPNCPVFVFKMSVWNGRRNTKEQHKILNLISKSIEQDYVKGT